MNALASCFICLSYGLILILAILWPNRCISTGNLAETSTTTFKYWKWWINTLTVFLSSVTHCHRPTSLNWLCQEHFTLRFAPQKCDCYKINFSTVGSILDTAWCCAAFLNKAHDNAAKWLIISYSKPTADRSQTHSCATRAAYDKYLPPIPPSVMQSVATLVEKTEAKIPMVATTPPTIATGRKSNWLLKALANGPTK